MNMENGGRHNIGKPRDIMDSDKYITLDILLKFASLEKIRITSSEPKDYSGRSGKCLTNSLGLKTNVRSKKYKKARYVITNVSMKDISKIIKDFEKSPYKGYVHKRPKQEPTDSYFYLARQLTNCMMRAGALNSHIAHVRTEMTGMQQALCATSVRARTMAVALSSIVAL